MQTKKPIAALEFYNNFVLNNEVSAKTFFKPEPAAFNEDCDPSYNFKTLRMQKLT